MNVSGVILAAGASSRMGQSKALLHYRGETFLGRIRRIFADCCRDVIVVGAPDSPFPVDVINPRPEQGMLSSLQCGLRAVPANVDAVLFTPVDLPAVDQNTVAAMIEGWRGELLRLPRYQGRRGHPVLFSHGLLAEFLAETGTAKDVILRHERDIVYLDVDDPGILLDADTPADYEKLIANA